MSVDVANIPDDRDRKIIVATQAGLPVSETPYDDIARSIGLSSLEVQERMARMLKTGVVRRIGVVPNHYRLGYKFNGMSVWDVDDDKISELGLLVGALDYVSHCYQRPRHLPVWPYNLFAMVHGHTRQEVDDKVAAIEKILGSGVRTHDVLFSTKILKKTGLRFQHRKQPDV